MGYTITEDDGKYTVWDGDLRLSTKDTDLAAIKVMKQWQTRDELDNDIASFIDSMISKHGSGFQDSDLPEDEIRQMIKAY